MATDVIFPKVDMDMETGKILRWHVKDGDTVKKGQALFEIETDKSAMEIEATTDGIVRNLAAVETPVPVGQAVAQLLAPGEALASKSATVATGIVQTAAPSKIAEVPLRVATPLSGTGVRATPLARRLARQNGINLGAILGSGPRGRIVASDVDAGNVITQLAPPAVVSAGTKLKPLDGMRRTIAQRLVHSKQTIPHFYLSVSCVLDELLATRLRLNAHAPLDANKDPVWKLSVNDFVIKALALALQRVPDANVTWSDDGILQHVASDIGVAVSVDGGLFTPVVRTAHQKTLSQISIEMKTLAGKARAKKLQPSDYQGGTSAISNLGMYGIEEFSAIINPPHATILAVGAGLPQFVGVNGVPVQKNVMKCTLSCDHRAVDGALGAQLLSAFKQLVEEPALMLA
jgi:pyruvate dehydrogenase E2 component (dihydrolipoamide acetyltransferase)